MWYYYFHSGRQFVFDQLCTTFAMPAALHLVAAFAYKTSVKESRLEIIKCCQA